MTAEQKSIIGKIVKGPAPNGSDKSTWLEIDLLEPGQSKPFTWKAFEHQKTIKEKAEWGKTYQWQVELKQADGQRYPYRNIVGIGDEVEFTESAPAAQSQSNGGPYASEDPDVKRISIERQKSAELALASFEIEADDPLFSLSFHERVDFIHDAIRAVHQPSKPLITSIDDSSFPEDAIPPSKSAMGIEKIKTLDSLMRYARERRWKQGTYKKVFENVEPVGNAWAGIQSGFELIKDDDITWREIAKKMDAEDPWT